MSTELSRGEVDEQRALTPGTGERIHFNHAGSSLPPQPVIDAQRRHLELEATIGGYEAAAEMAEVEEQVYESIASLIGAKPSEIARAEHATVAWCSAFWSLPMEAGQRILTAEAEYAANAVSYIRAKERYGISIEVVPSDPSGQLDLEALDAAIDSDVALISVTHIPTNGGLINPAAEIGRIARAASVPYLLDACQSVGQLDIDVDEIGCDLLSVTGRKYLRGPRGSGFLYASEGIIDRLNTDHPDHHSAHWVESERYELLPDARRFEYWEFNHAAWLGLGAAVDHARSIGTDRIEATVKARANELRSKLDDGGFPVYDIGANRGAIVTTNVPGIDATELKARLGAQRINTSVSTPDSTLWDAQRRGLPDMLRASVHYTTTSEEIDELISALTALAS